MTSGDVDPGAGPLPRRRWLVANVVDGLGEPLRGEYASAWALLVRVVLTDPDWVSWWRQAGAGRLELRVAPATGDPARDRPGVTRGRTAVRVACARGSGGADDDGGLDPIVAAAGDLRTVLGVVRESLGLPAPPPIPPLPDPHAAEEAGARPSGIPQACYADLPEGTDVVVQTLVEVMGVPLEQARVLVGGTKT